MSKRKYFRSAMAVTLSAAMLLGSVSSVCAATNTDSGKEDTKQEAEATQAAEETDAASEDGQEQNPLAVTEPVEGSPWNDTQIIGNLPEEKPEATEDYYTYADYDLLEEHQDGEFNNMAQSGGGYKEAVLAYLQDESKQSDLLDQARILYEQASDTDAQQEAGFSDVRPYLDMIEDAESLDELSEVLASDDFPFDPFLQLSVSPHGMDGNNIVSIGTNFLFTDSKSQGSQDYQDTELAADQSDWSSQLQLYYLLVSVLMGVLKEDNTQDYQEELSQLISLEYSYGKDSCYGSMDQEIEYGTNGDYVSLLSMEELQKLAGDFPIEKILTKYGCENSESFMLKCSDWLQEFGALYTEDNLDLLKDLAALKVLEEAYLLMGVAGQDAVQSAMGQNAVTYTEEEKASAAYAVMSNVDCFSNELGSMYLNEIASKEDTERITTMVTKIRDAYAEMIKNCDWIDEDTREAIEGKLETLRLDVLQPDIGYDDYSDIQLVSTEDGGTLFGNYLIMKEYNWEKQLARLGKEADSASAWYVFGASYTNAFYDSESNSIHILPGFLNEATYTSDMTETEFYAAIGTVVGHEISHGFDVCGSQYDENGLPNVIFSEDDKAEYLEKVKKLESYFSNITVGDDMQVDGNYVSAEATADLCGIRASLNALQESEDQIDYEDYFETYSQMWGSTMQEASVQMYLQTDTHNQNYIRVNADCQMMDEFYDTYDVQEDDNMYLAEGDRLSFWW